MSLESAVGILVVIGFLLHILLETIEAGRKK